MFNPSREEVRRFFCEAWRKHCEGGVTTPLEVLAIACIEDHPEYHALLADAARAQEMDFPVEAGHENPFLHLAMHLALREQESIDQPPGIRALLEQLRRRAGDAHGGAHAAMECLGEVVWRTQRGTLPADPMAINEALLDCLRRRAS